MAIEIEAKFLEIDKKKLISKLKKVGAKDLGESLLSEIIFYDRGLKMKKANKFIRIRKIKDKCFLSYKHHKVVSVDGTEELELEIESMDEGRSFLENIGFIAYRYQEKKRHSFVLNNVKIDIDTWPKIPTYVELEGDSEKIIRKVAEMLEFSWEKAVFESAREVIENKYNIPIGNLKLFTFDKIA